ncbi:hypothetical protein KP509_26G058600 [Ceratopteris richardii]|uniref:CCHC-type domain-containing protein n=1 Tax=Ceratopteris richardii TaxID=49495 RepID=A0A8T2RL41_CERRI|nr:hypothetical protein KP509_26G058600 [Ceratopteris richardii]
MEQNWEPEYSNVMYTNPIPRPQLRQMRPQAPRGSCFRCQGDHFIRDCPHPPSPSQGQVITIQAFCPECGKDHLPRDCPRNPSSAPKITPINVVGLVADSSSSSSNVAPIQAVTRAEALKQDKLVEQSESSESGEPSKRKTRTWKDTREKANRKWNKKLSELEESLKEAKTKIDDIATQSPSHAETPSTPPHPTLPPIVNRSQPGSVLADPTLEGLDMMFKAYQARLQEGPTIANLDKSYPRADLEIERMKMCMKMVEQAQAILETTQKFNQTNSVKSDLHFQGLLERLEQLVNKPQVSLPPQAQPVIERGSSPPMAAYIPNSTDAGIPPSIQQYSQEFLREIQEEKWAKKKGNSPPIP